MAGLGNLVVTLSTQISEFTAGLDKASREAQAWRGKIEKTLGAIGIGLSAHAFADFIKGTIDAADKLNDLRTRTGLTGQQLLTLQGAAARGGVAMEEVDGVVSKLTRRLNEAQKGTGDAAGAWEALNIKLRDGAGLKDIYKLLGEAGKKFKEFEDGPEKAALAVAAFGKGGDRLIPVAQSIADTEERFKRLGITISEDFISAADEFNDALEDMKALSQQFGREIAEELLPTMQDLVNAMIELKKEGNLGSVIGEGLKITLQAVTVFGSEVLFVLKGVRNEIGGIAAQLIAFAEASARALVFDIEGANEAFRRGTAIRDEMRADAEKARAAQDRLVATLMGEAGTGSTMPPARAPRGNRKRAPAIRNPEEEKKAANAYQDLLRDLAKANVALLEDEGKKQLAILSAQHAQQLVGDKEFFDQKLALAQQSTAARLRELDSELQAQVAFASKQKPGSAEYYKAQQDILKTLTERAKVEKEAGQAAVIGNLEAAAAANQYRRANEEVLASVLELQGKELEASQIRIRNRNETLYNQAKANRDIGAMTQLDTLGALSEAQDAFSTKREEASRINERLTLEEERIQRTLKTGAISELEALQRTSDARRAAAASMEGIVQAAERMAASSPSEKLKIQAEQMRESLEKLKGETNLLADKFETIFADAAGQAFADFISGAKTAKEAFNDFGRSVLRMINQMVAEALAKRLFNAIFSGAGGGGGFNLLNPSTWFGGGGIGYGAAGTAAATNMVSNGAGGFVGVLAEGTDYVPRTGLALIHKGEAVIPASENSARLRGVGITVHNSFVIQGDVNRRSQEQITVAAGLGVRRAMARSS